MKQNILIALILPCMFSTAKAQIITTIAGNGANTYSVTGGPATSSSMVTHDCSVDTAGNIFISSRENLRVCKVSPAGIATTFAGGGTVLGDGGPATAAIINSPNWTHADKFGNVYISEEENRIRRVDASGIITTFAGTGTSGFAGDSGLATAALINDSYGITTDSVGNVFFADAYNNRIRRIDRVTNIITTVAGIGPVGLSGALFAGDGGPATAAQLSDPTCVVFDKNGNLLFSDYSNNRIRKIDTAGIITTVAGNGTAGYTGDDIPATDAELFGPFSVTFDPCGDLYIADANNSCIRKVDASGIIHTIAGTPTMMGFAGDNGPATDAKLSAPAGITFDNQGRLLIAAYGSNRIRMVTGLAISAGAITGIDSVCHGFTSVLADTVAGGVWSSSNTSVSTVSTSGIVTGIHPGVDTIIYTVTAPGCTVKTIFPFTVSPPSICNVAVPNAPVAEPGTISFFPNPVNTGLLTVNISSRYDEEAEITVSDLLGEKIREITTRTNMATNISLVVPVGIYILGITTPGNKWNQQILVTEH